MAVHVREYQNDDRSELVPLLLIGDADEKKVSAYLNAGRVFVAERQNEIVGVVLVLAASSETIEVKNISVGQGFQGAGIGTALIEFVCSYFAQSYLRAIVGTGDADVQNILFYLKRGFRFYGVKKNFFADYAEPIVANGVRLQDMVMLEKDLH